MTVSSAQRPPRQRLSLTAKPTSWPEAKLVARPGRSPVTGGVARRRCRSQAEPWHRSEGNQKLLEPRKASES